MPIQIDIVLPCYNPPISWVNELLAFNQFLNKQHNINYIIVNDGSTTTNFNDSLSFLSTESINFQYVSYLKNKGKGFALRKGLESSAADYTLYTDCDFPFTNESMLGLLNSLITSNKDIVVGFRDDAYYTKKMSVFRKMLSKTFRFFVKNILNMPVTDTQCGLKGFNTKGKEKFLKTTIDRYLFDFEFIYSACKDKQLSILPVQVLLKENVVFSKMKLKIIFQETLNLLRILVFK